MVAKVTKDGLLIPRSLLRRITTVEIRRRKDRITLLAPSRPDPIRKLGRKPVPAGCADAAANQNVDRWGLYIDVEGFSSIYDKDKLRAIRALNELMEALYTIGSSGFSKAKGRIFMHQLGDGFVVVSEFPEETPETPLSICLGVMRHLIARGVATKAGISGGGFSDVFGAYPPAIQKAAEDHRYVPLGDNSDYGLMTIIPVMGSALTRSHRLLSRQHGALLLLDTTAFCRLPSGIITRAKSPTVIDWVHSDFPRVRELCNSCGLEYVNSSEAEAFLRKYVKDNRPCLPPEWVSSTMSSAALANPLF
jgi:hypothetical protein